MHTLMLAYSYNYKKIVLKLKINQSCTNNFVYSLQISRNINCMSLHC